MNNATPSPFPQATYPGAVVAYPPLGIVGGIVAGHRPSADPRLPRWAIVTRPGQPGEVFIREDELRSPTSPQARVLCPCATEARCPIHGPHVHAFDRRGLCKNPTCNARKAGAA